MDGKVGEIVVGAYGGSYKAKETIEALQFVNMNHTEKVEDSGAMTQGKLVGHEVLESFIAAQENGGVNSANSSEGNTAYTAGHNGAAGLDGADYIENELNYNFGIKTISFPSLKNPDGSIKAVN